MDADGWRRLYQTAIRQSLVGVCYQGVCLLPEGSKPPVEIAMQWVSEAEIIEAIRRAYDYGCTFFDTAEGYGGQRRDGRPTVEGWKGDVHTREPEEDVLLDVRRDNWNK